MCSALDNNELNGLLPDFSKIPNLVTLYVTFMTITFVQYWIISIIESMFLDIDHEPI
jgi:hypothetical protein